MTEFRQLKGGEIAQVREDILQEQGGCCAICGIQISDETGYSLDHQHKTKAEPNGPDGAGLVRGVLCRACNVWEGKIWNSTTRYRQPESVAERIEMLKSLIRYYEAGTYDLIHPSEKPVEPKVSKRNYNRLKKEYSGKKKFPEYPKSGKLTMVLQALFEEYKIEPFN